MAPFGLNDNSVPKGIELRLDTAILGLQQHLPATVTSIVIGTQSYSVADAIKLLQSRVEPWKAKRAAKAALRQLAVDEDRDYEAALQALSDLRASLGVSLGRTNEALTNFGFKPERQRRDLTPEEKVLRAAKAKATREARHTLGSRQKAEIKGEDVKQVVVTPEGTKPSNANQQGPTHA